ncbi:hypothetical protein LJC01_02195 [Clostridiaceae bacterium OttesenSCG-928-D20]|nr:hypothetical protein [Clostridiaceae bacterium OttesenSCG-928-D20]
MLDTITNTLLSFFEDNKINAVLEYPPRLISRDDEHTVSIGTRSAKISSSGFGDYIGLEKGSERELFALKVEQVLGMGIYCPVKAAGSPIKIFEKIASCISKLPSGIKVSGLICGETAIDRETGLRRSDCEIHLEASLLCHRDEETGEFLDFKIKGNFQ